jgi:hypothetical protein
MIETDRERRMREAVERETLSERRERLVRDIEIFDLPQWERQREMLRAGIAELPPPGTPADAMTWREWSRSRAAA